MARLCDNASKIISGQILSRVEAKNESDSRLTCKAIVPKAIDTAMIKHDQLTEIHLKDIPDQLRMTIAGDIVIKLSPPYNAAIISDCDEGLLVTSFCAVIRNISPSYCPEFIVAYLNGPIAQAAFREGIAGSNAPLLRVNTLKELEIPLISLDKQLALTDIFNCNQRQIICLNRLLETAKEFNDSLLMEALEV